MTSTTPKVPSVIVNTSPLLYLHQVNQLDILQKLYGQVATPSAVLQELSVGQSQGITVRSRAPRLQDSCRGQKFFESLTDL